MLPRQHVHSDQCELHPTPLDIDVQVGSSVETVQPGRFTGQVIRDGERIVYASLPATKKWLADNKWQTAKAFAI